MKRIIALIVLVFMSVMSMANIQMTETAVVKATKTAIAKTMTATISVTPTLTSSLTPTNSATLTSYQATNTAIAVLTIGTSTNTYTPTITKTPSNTLSPTSTGSITSTFTPTYTYTNTPDTRTAPQKTSTALAGGTATQAVVLSFTSTNTPVNTATFTLTPTSTSTPTATYSPTIAITVTNYGVNSVSIAWNDPAWTLGGTINVNATPVWSMAQKNYGTPINLTGTVNIGTGKNVITATSKWGNGSYAAGTLTNTAATSITIYNLGTKNIPQLITQLAMDGLLASQSLTATAAVGYVNTTVYAQDEVIFNTSLSAPSVTTFQNVIGGTYYGTTGTGGTVNDIGYCVANGAFTITPVAAYYLIPAGTPFKISISASSASDIKTFGWTAAKLTDIASLAPAKQ